MVTPESEDDTSTATDQSADSLQLVIDAFDASWKYTEGSWQDRWDDNYKLYNNVRIKRGYLGISDTFVPMTFSTVETLTSALFGNKPKFDYLPPYDNEDQDTAVLNALVDYFWDKDQWSMKVINTGRGCMREGNGIDYFCWEIDHPRLINVPLRDFFIDPNAFELDESSTHYCGRRYLTTLDDLEDYEIVDLDGKPDADGNYPMKPKYQHLDQLKGDNAEEPVKGSVSAENQQTDKQQKDMFYGSTLDNPEKDQVEVIEYWTVDKTISIANRKVVIEDTDNYYKAQDKANGAKYPKGLLPFAAARDYTDPSLFYAKGEVDFIADQQEDLNDVTNQNKDAISFNLNSMKTLDPKYGHLINEIENIPGNIIPVEPNALMPVVNAPIPPDAFNERQNIKAEIRETTASNEVIKGAPQTGPNSGNQTATEINAQIAGAGQRISLKVTQLENEYFHRMAKIVFRMIQLYVKEPMMVRILGKDGVDWQKFDPKEFQGEYEPRVQLDISMQAKKQQQAADAANLLKAFLNDPNVNQQELTKLVLQKGFDLEPDEVQLLMTPQPVPAAPPTSPSVPGMPQPGQSAPGNGGDIQALLAAAQQQPSPPQPTDIVPHPATGEPVMAGSLQ